MKDKILEYNRQPQLSQWFNSQLDKFMASGIYHDNLDLLENKLVSDLENYKNKYQIENVVLGVSGGIDSAVSAALFKNAGWNVTGVLLPILQNPEETDRGQEVCDKLEIECVKVDLTSVYEKFISEMRDADFLLFEGLDNSKEVRVRRGNIRARLRMNTLYNMAASKKGLVASTDNFSELAAGFWTLHGDVGDIAPIQSLTKSWEVPALAERLGVPQSVIDAVPTDGLGVANGDEDQFGFSYLEFDIALFSLFESKYIKQQLEDDNDANIINEVEKRIRSTIYKRFNPLNLQHPYYTERYSQLEELDNHLDKGD
tara:strand:+ start:145 stop:1086 length:942 start_codon:yes stop_codon:yes gene_type:complete